MKELSKLIIYKSRKLIIAHKPAGISSQINLGEEKSLQELLEIYVKRKLYIISRLDQPVAGLVLFASEQSAAGELSALVREGSIKKTYLALVEKLPPKSEDEITHYVSRNSKNRKALINNSPAKGYKEAILQYKLVHSFNNYHLLEIQTKTGRFHQIRVQMAHIGCPIKGDVKYGARRSNPDRSIHLLSYVMNFRNPFSNEDVSYKAEIPDTDGLWKDVKSLDYLTK